MRNQDSAGQRERERIEALQDEWNLRNKKIKDLRKALAIEADPSRKF